MKDVRLDESDLSMVPAMLDLAAAMADRSGHTAAARKYKALEETVKACGGSLPARDALDCIKAFDMTELALQAVVETAPRAEKARKRELYLDCQRYKAVLAAQLDVGYVKIAYRAPKRFSPENKELLDRVIAIVDEYKQQGYRMTLRQLYYQLVSRNVIENVQGNYQKISDLLKDARMTGLVDWNFIEDRVRTPRIHGEFDGPADLLDAAIASYRRPRWLDQEHYVEVWVEKDALSGVLYPITDAYHVRLLVNRGYSSVSAMHDASLRFIEAVQHGKKCVLLYLGDHDPSGEDMVRDIRERLREFWAAVKVVKVALTMEQIEEHQPPPNPAKTTDPRATGYIDLHGDQSWELDALRPDVLEDILRDALDEYVDREKYDAVVATEDGEKVKLEKVKHTFMSAEAGKA